MVGIVIVSHSREIAAGTAALAAQMAGPEVRIEAAGGAPDGGLGTDGTLVGAAIAAADQGDGAIVLGDLGSAILTVRTVLEDHEDVRAHSVEVLHELGYVVLEAGDGPGALALIEAHGDVDLLFTDVVLPGGKSGAQVAAEAKARWPRLKVLFTTGYARNAIVHHGRLDIGVHLLTKPFSFDALAVKVRQILDA